MTIGVYQARSATNRASSLPTILLCVFVSSREMISLLTQRHKVTKMEFLWIIKLVRQSAFDPFQRPCRR